VSLSKSTESKRSNTHLDKYPVYESLPSYFELEYPTFTKFLEAYYDDFTSQEKIRQISQENQFIRDFVEAGDDLLRFLSQELLLGRDYFNKFVDQRGAIQVSNLLYRSKGTQHAIQLFFRVFFGFDVDVRYGQDEVFLVGDPRKEEVVYKSSYRDSYLYPGNRLRFNFDDGDIQVYATSQVDNIYHALREDIDYTIDYTDNSIILQPLEDGYSAVRDDPWLNALAETGYMPEGMSAKIEVRRYSPSHSAIGAEVTNKRITDNGFWQLYSLAIRSPVPVSKWREMYKDFVHPAGMYFESEVIIETTDKIFGTQPSVIIETYRKPVFSEAEVLAKMQASITELNIDKFVPSRTSGYTQSGFVQNDRTPYRTAKAFDSDGMPFYAEERLVSDRPDTVYRTRINDIKDFSKKGFTLEQLDDQYQRMDRIDTIEPRRFDNVEADFSSSVNVFDENQWYGQGDIFCLDSDGNSQFSVLGNLLDFPKEYAGCPGFHFNLFGLLNPLRGYNSTEGTPQGDNFNLVSGVARKSFSAYRDQRVWGFTADPGTSQTAPGQPFNFTNNVDSFGNQLGGTSRWDFENDYVNMFESAVVQGVARTMRTYFLNRDPITNLKTSYIDLSPGTPGAGDSDDYMVAQIKTDSAGGSGFGPAHLDSAFDSTGSQFP
jgi:hypothetical protein